jgi:hypothetical protein
MKTGITNQKTGKEKNREKRNGELETCYGQCSEVASKIYQYC